jgi:hypothetical protein
MSSGGGFSPKWVMLECFVFHMDDEEYFPDENKAPVSRGEARASVTRVHTS